MWWEKMLVASSSSTSGGGESRKVPCGGAGTADCRTTVHSLTVYGECKSSLVAGPS